MTDYLWNYMEIVHRSCPDCDVECPVRDDHTFTCPDCSATFKWEPDYSLEGDPPAYRDTSTVTRL